MTSNIGPQTVAVIGAGGIGGILAAAAAAAGHAVTLCVRHSIDKLIIAEASGSERVVKARIITDPADAAPADWVIVATKVQDTESAKGWLERLVKPGTVVVAAQNGLGHEARLRPLVGTAPVIAALIHIAVERTAPGRVVHHSGQNVDVPAGEPGAAFARLMGTAVIKVREDPDFAAALWRKLMGNLVANPITTLTLRRIGVMREPAIQALTRTLLDETVAVGRAAGVDLGEKDIASCLRYFAERDTTGGTSMFYDRIAGKGLEHEHLTGALVREADRLGVPVPVNRAILALLEGVDHGLRSGELGPIRA